MAGQHLAAGKIEPEGRGKRLMKSSLCVGNRSAAKWTAAVLCFSILVGLNSLPVLAGEAEDAAAADDPYRLVDIYCSQSAKEALGDEQLKDLIDCIVTSIEPQAVNLLLDSFPCFKDAAANDEIGREIGMYIYYGAGDQDGIEEHENVASGSYAYVLGTEGYEEGESFFQYMIGIDAEAISTVDESDQARLDLDEQTRVQLDTTFCHELVHAFMDDYNRVGMSGYTDFDSYIFSTEEEITEEEGEELIKKTVFPNWFEEGLAGCVGNIYPADLVLFREYQYAPAAQEYLDFCTDDQLCCMYANMGYREGTGEDRYDLEAASEDNSDGHVNGATYVSGYMACLYLADLACQQMEGSGAVTFDQTGAVTSISSEKLREGLSEILYRLHRGDTRDEVIHEISGGAYEDTEDFTKRFIKGTYDEEAQDYTGDAESLSFCVGYLNYMSRLDAMDPETHPAGSVLMDDFGSAQPTPLEKDAAATSDFYRIIEENTLTASTVPNEKAKDGGTSYSGRDSFETVVEMFKGKDNP